MNTTQAKGVIGLLWWRGCGRYEKIRPADGPAYTWEMIRSRCGGGKFTGERHQVQAKEK